jgi:hypothetical protein
MICSRCGSTLGVKITHFLPVLSFIQVELDDKTVSIGAVEEFELEEDIFGTISQCVACQYSNIEYGKGFATPPEFCAKGKRPRKIGR